MRDKKLIAIHRGGSLSTEHHRQLINWAIKCAGRVVPLMEGNIDNRLIHALHIADEWAKGKVTTGNAMKASVNAHAAARSFSNPIYVAIARAIGHTVATAHMADHAAGGALYALKALKIAGKSTDEEKNWQIDQLRELPQDIIDLIIQAMITKGKAMKV